MDITKRIKAKYNELSKGHKKIASVVLEEYDKIAYMTASNLGKYVGISESTVVRFADVLGYAGYSEFQDAIQELLRACLTPNQRIDVTKQRIGASDIIEKVFEADAEKMKSTYEKLNRDAFYSTCDAIVSAKRIFVMGARSTEPLAMILKYNLSFIFDNVSLIAPKSTAEVYEQMFSIGEGDLLVAFSFPRYSSKMVNAVKFAKENGASVAVVTDSENSPLAEHASNLITAESDMASFMDSLIAPISIINAMIIEITHRCEDRIKERFNRLERIWDGYGVYAKK